MSGLNKVLHNVSMAGFSPGLRSRGPFFALLTLLLLCSAASLPLRASEFQPRVVGGINVSIDFAPSIVGILDRSRFDRLNSSYRSLFCGGTVIQSEWVLTAAHCMIDSEGNEKPASSLLITMGARELDGGFEVLFDVTEVIIHESYISTVSGDDIALLRLSRPASVEPTPLETGEIVLNRDARIAGWGALIADHDGDDDFPRLLQGTIVNLIPGEDCNTRFPVYFGRVTARQLCAGVLEGGRDTCQGDSGGPIYRIGDDNEITLAGITSWGSSCALPDRPGVYTRVGAYTDWINSKIQSDQPGVNVSTNSSSGGSGGGSSSVFLILPLWCLAVLRRSSGDMSRRRTDRGPVQFRLVTALRNLFVALILMSTLGCLPVQPLVAGDPSMITLSSLEQALGEELSTQLPELQSQWQENASCESKKTGVGLNRRAYFLDICHFENVALLSVCGQVPDAADYYFLEGKLVQISVRYQPENELASCLKTETVSAGYKAVAQLGVENPILATEQRRVMATDDTGLGLIVEPTILTMMQVDVAPDVHFLKAMFAASEK